MRGDHQAVGDELGRHPVQGAHDARGGHPQVHRAGGQGEGHHRLAPGGQGEVVELAGLALLGQG